MGTNNQCTMDQFYSYTNMIVAQTPKIYTQIDDGSIDNAFGMSVIGLIQSKTMQEDTLLKNHLLHVRELSPYVGGKSMNQIRE